MSRVFLLFIFIIFLINSREELEKKSGSHAGIWDLAERKVQREGRLLREYT
jgi:hypothetical protein